MPKTLEEQLKRFKDSVSERAKRFRIFVRFDELTDEHKKQLKGDKGEKGDQGNPPTEKELLSLIKPLIPEPIKGEKGDTPSEEQLKSIIQPLIPAPIKGEKGDTPNIELIADVAVEKLQDVTLKKIESTLTRREASLWEKIKEMVAKAAQGNSRIGGGGTYIHIGPIEPPGAPENALWIRTNN